MVRGLVSTRGFVWFSPVGQEGGSDCEGKQFCVCTCDFVSLESSIVDQIYKDVQSVNS